MARIRTIKPEFWKSEKLASKLSGADGRQARLLFIAIWNFAEDHGIARGHATYLRNEVFGYDDDVTADDVRRWLELLEVARMVVRFQRDGCSYLWIRGFAEHQRIDKPSKTNLPEPTDEEKERIHVSEASLQEVSATIRGALHEPSRLEGKGREGSGREQEAPAERSPRAKKASGADPRLKALCDELVEAYRQIRGEKYLHKGSADTEALKRMLAVAEPPEIVRRFVFGIQQPEGAWLLISTFGQLASKWNDLGNKAPAKHTPGALIGSHGSSGPCSYPGCSSTETAEWWGEVRCYSHQPDAPNQPEAA